MTLAARAIAWTFVYLGVVLAPLVFAAIGASQPDHDFWTDFSVALGFTGLAMLGLEFALVARFQTVASAFGQDGLLQFHRQIGYVGLAFVLTHFALSARWDALTLHNALRAPLLVWFGMAALFALVLLVASSTWRRQLRLSYEAWHVAHAVLATVLIVGAVGHIYFVDEYVSALWKQLLWGAMAAAFLCLLIWVRLVKPSRAAARPWRVAGVRAERGDTTVVGLSPPDGVDFRFQPGQFAWFTFDRSPFSLTQHPFSFSSSAETGEVEVAIKALGDFTSTVKHLEPGTTAYVDGPHGVFSIDQDEGPGFVLIAGGVGISGLISMLRTLADRDDVRPVLLFYGNRAWDEVAFRDELDRLRDRLDLTLVHVLERPPAEWHGETGYITADVLGRHLPRSFERFQYFICGPGAMMDAAEAALAELGVPAERVHTERFDMA
ncbi:ferric reductase-like transmembrane domain-containing protein [Conexibacter arvalis]|uniref:Putative ferric reductase n=1 Tax=Conexibacter arvalis TaxID=912552 RepID=A0A840IA52_9ACTN|nr:putative ferric reductase [Conexibacter arvalis]